MAVHVVFVLNASDQTEAWQTAEEVGRVASILDAVSQIGLSHLTLIEEFSGPTNLISYFNFLLQKIENKGSSFYLKVLDEVDASASGNEPLQVNLIPDYHGKRDVISSVKGLAKNCEPLGEAGVPGSEVLEAAIGNGLRTSKLPEPDLIVLFNGHNSLGEAGVWMGAYSEFAFLDKPWHSFSAEDLKDLLADFGMRERRFGAV